MKYHFDGYNYLIRLDKGERLSEAIAQFATETKIEGAWINGLGAVLEVTIGFYDLETKTYQMQTLPGDREMASLTGNLAYDEHGVLVPHLHGVFAGRDLQAIGGHVKDFVAGATIELFVHRAYQPTRRKLDREVGLQTFDL
jgi:hypothetical protein